MRRRIAANGALGTAIAANWKVMKRRTIYAPILIRISRSAVGAAA